MPEAQRKMLCKNISLVMNLPLLFVFTAKSTFSDKIVGLFAGEKIKKDKIIMEYTGKVVRNENLKDQVDSIINDFRGRSYGFTLDDKTALDAVYTGNLMRFANHSSSNLINCMIKILFC